MTKKNQIKTEETGQIQAEELYIAWDLPKAASMVNAGLAIKVIGTIQKRLALSNAELSELLLYITPNTRQKKERRNTSRQ